MTYRHMRSKFGNLCCVCRKNIYVGSEIYWNDDGSSKVKHYDCNAITRGARAINVPEESVDLAAKWGAFPIITYFSWFCNFMTKIFLLRKLNP